MEYKLHMVEAYTDIEFSTDVKERYNEYDDLCQRGIYDTVIEKIGAEADECLKLLDMVTYDIEREIECKLDASQCKILQTKLIGIMNPEQDSLRFYYLGNNYENKIEHFGCKETYMPDDPMII